MEAIDNDIEMRTKLIEQLELTNSRYEQMRTHYEEKLSVLYCKIENTQKERDDVLANMSKQLKQKSISFIMINDYNDIAATSVSTPSKDSLKKVKTDYESKISHMQTEIRKLQNAQREHIRSKQQLKSHEVRIGTLRNELNELKFAKVS